MAFDLFVSSVCEWNGLEKNGGEIKNAIRTRVFKHSNYDFDKNDGFFMGACISYMCLNFEF